MSLAFLFGKLEEHELKLSQFKQHEEQEKNCKNISLKAWAYSCHTSGDEIYEDGMEDMNLLVKKFKKFLTKKRRQGWPKKHGHVKVDYPTLNKNPFKEKAKKKTTRRA
ncbi:hypothetical protein Lal_00038532 [Lupinus albus]|nr:hypothetical protein Lal_00038532 [Lupinus albus]